MSFAAQQTSTAKLPAFFRRFHTEKHVLWVNKTKSAGENAFNGDHLGTEGNHESSNDKKNLFWVFLLIVTLALTLRPRIDRVYTSFEHSLVFAIFKPLPVGFRS